MSTKTSVSSKFVGWNIKILKLITVQDIYKKQYRKNVDIEFIILGIVVLFLEIYILKCFLS